MTQQSLKNNIARLHSKKSASLTQRLEYLEDDLGVFVHYKKHGLAQRIARHSFFDRFTLFVIFLNALYFAIDANFNTASSIETAELGFVLTDLAFCVYFTWELWIRFMAFEKTSVALRNAWWIFDFLLGT